MNVNCKLPPFKIKEVISIQEAKQKAGWSITKFNLPEIWKFSKGEGVKVAIIDTGVSLKHEDLANNILPGYNFVANNDIPDDDAKHGTHCAGIIASECNSIGIIGYAPKCKIIPLKALDKHGNGDLATVAKSIKWAVDHGADLISMSLGAPRPLQQIAKAIKYACNNNVITFCAVGNAGEKTKAYYPASYPYTISVGAIDQNLVRAKFTNFGKIDFLCPGVNILSTIPKNWYAEMSGTSMATPHAVGIASLILSHYRKTDKGGSLKTIDDFRHVLSQYTIPLDDIKYKGKKQYEGLGILDPRKIKLG